MIVVIEGISAVGKTTYSLTFGAAHHVHEFPETGTPPVAHAPAEELAQYWIEHNIRRFQAALEVEAKHGFAICDTEPFKSHFDWCMAKAGFKNMDVFKAAMPLAREAIEQRRIGFGDLYFVKHLAPDLARAQKEGDLTRTRSRFDMHLALQPFLISWYEVLSEVLPGRVEFDFPDKNELLERLKNKSSESISRRFDVSVLDTLVARLDD